MQGGLEAFLRLVAQRGLDHVAAVLRDSRDHLVRGALPHEHDQSSDSQQNQDGTAPRVGRQAFNDIERGVVDTDRGPVTDRVYNDKVKR